jgi:catechol 2,3-dioxygenase-like lactoylglutathione lyase family enzyme
MDSNTGSAGVLRTAHVSLVVSNLERSLRYYCEGLGFRELFRMEMGQEVATVGLIEGEVRFNSVLVGRDGLVLQIITWPSPGVTHPPGVKPLTESGLTHIGIIVEDVDKALDALVKLGGSVIPGTRTKLEGADIVMTLDPDGTRIEIERVENVPHLAP